MILKGYLASIIYGLVCIAIAGIAHRLGMKTVYTRKIAHILIGFEWVILYHYFGTSYHFLIVCLVFLVIITISYLTKLFPQISSPGDNSLGTVYYCIAMTIMAFVTMLFPKMAIPFGIGVFCTSLGDGFAGVFGQIGFKNKKIYGEKTLFGSIACFVFSFLSTILISYLYDFKKLIYQALIVALVATELEIFSKRGFDNILVTLGASLLTFGFATVPLQILNYVLPITLTLPIVAFVHHKNALTKGGITFALALDLLVSIAFGNSGFLVLVAFFCGSLITDKLKRKKTAEKSEKRNANQVLANGSVGALIALISLIFPQKLWFIAFCASFAEAFADTAASGIGSFSKKTYDPFRRMTVEKGISGGMSVVGTLTSLIASAIISLVSLSFWNIGIIEFVIILLSGFVGCLFDSFLGSLLQVKYKCNLCGRITEKESHCGEPTERYSGVAFVDNNFVNLFGTAFSASISILFFFIFN